MRRTFTAKLATVNKDGAPHVAPIWFVLDDSGSSNTDDTNDFHIVFTTGYTSVKAKNMLRDSRVSICVDDQTPPFSFVAVFGIVEKISEESHELLNWATRIAERYVGKENAKAYGKRNSGEGEILVRVKPKKIIAEKNIAGWD